MSHVLPLVPPRIPRHDEAFRVPKARLAEVAHVLGLHTALLPAKKPGFVPFCRRVKELSAGIFQAHTAPFVCQARNLVSAVHINTSALGPLRSYPKLNLDARPSLDPTRWL